LTVQGIVFNFFILKTNLVQPCTDGKPQHEFVHEIGNLHLQRNVKTCMQINNN